MVRVQSSIDLLAEPFFDFCVFRGGLQNTRTCHEDLVIFLLPNSIRFERLTRSAIDVSCIEMEIAGVHRYRPKPSGVAMQRIDLPCLPQLRDGLVTKLLIAGPQSGGSRGGHHLRELVVTTRLT